MLEIIALVFLTRKIGDVAEQKGLPKGKWKLYTVLAWFGAELFGFFIAVQFFGIDNIIGLVLFALASAFGGYLIVKSTLDKKPDSMDREIDRIGEEE